MSKTTETLRAELNLGAAVGFFTVGTDNFVHLGSRMLGGLWCKEGREEYSDHFGTLTLSPTDICPVCLRWAEEG